MYPGMGGKSASPVTQDRSEWKPFSDSLKHLAKTKIDFGFHILSVFSPSNPKQQLANLMISFVHAAFVFPSLSGAVMGSAHKAAAAIDENSFSSGYFY